MAAVGHLNPAESESLVIRGEGARIETSRGDSGRGVEGETQASESEPSRF